MLKFKEISLKASYPGFGKGARPAYDCAVELQYGEHSYETFKADLDPDEVRQVITLAVNKAIERLTIDFDSIDVEGSAGEDRSADLEAPEFSKAIDAALKPHAEEIA
jgi:hypothetical protein